MLCSILFLIKEVENIYRICFSIYLFLVLEKTLIMSRRKSYASWNQLQLHWGQAQHLMCLLIYSPIFLKWTPHSKHSINLKGIGCLSPYQFGGAALIKKQLRWRCTQLQLISGKWGIPYRRLPLQNFTNEWLDHWHSKPLDSFPFCWL